MKKHVPEANDNRFWFAMTMAVKAHEGQKDKAGVPYICHPIRVAYKVRDAGGTVEQQIVAVLHDVVEDTPVTLDDIRAKFGDDIASGVDAVSRREGEVYREFIKRALAHPIGRLVKVIDVMDNFGRIDAIPDADSRGFLRTRYEMTFKLFREHGVEF